MSDAETIASLRFVAFDVPRLRGNEKYRFLVLDNLATPKTIAKFKSGTCRDLFLILVRKMFVRSHENPSDTLPFDQWPESGFRSH